VIGLLLRLYPAHWRERYGDELKELVADSGLGPSAVVDITRAAAVERQRTFAMALEGGETMTLGPAWRHPTSWALVGALLMAPTVLLALVSGLAYSAGIDALVPLRQAALDLVATFPRFVDLILLLIPLLAAAIALIPLVRIGLAKTESGRELSVTVRLRWVNLVIGAIGILISGLLIWNVFAESVLGVG
jgi:hypothetical protein